MARSGGTQETLAAVRAALPGWFSTILAPLIGLVAVGSVYVFDGDTGVRIADTAEDHYYSIVPDNDETANVTIKIASGSDGKYLATTDNSDGSVDASGGVSAHGELTGLGGDDHAHYLKADGTRSLAGNLSADALVTIDGRDLSVDGTKLDGIESGATADQSAAEILTAVKTVDGSGSGLDADLIDGIDSAEFIQRDGSVPLTANYDVGAFTITALTLVSDVATGTAPLTVSSTTTVSNLSADTVDGIEGANFVRSDVADQVDGVLTFAAVPTSTGAAGSNNEVWGGSSGSSIIAGVDGNTILGRSTGTTTDGDNNVIAGYLADTASGVDNSVVIGKGAQSQGDGQTVIGLNTDAGTAANVIMIGNTCGNSSLTGSANVGMGSFAFASATSATRNFGFGNTCLQNLTIGASNVAMGIAAGNTVVGGSRNILLGDTADCAAANTDTVCVGHQATASGNYAVLLGSGNTGGQDCVVIGGLSTAGGTGAIAIGRSADSGSANNGIYIGAHSGRGAGTGAANFAAGAFALDAFTSGNRNFALGNSSLSALNTGYSNVGLGVASGGTITNGIQNILIGDTADCGASQSNVVAIGDAISVTANSAIGIGASVVVSNLSVVIGQQASDSAAKQFVCGSSIMPIEDVFFSEGTDLAADDTAGIDLTFHAQAGGTDGGTASQGQNGGTTTINGGDGSNAVTTNADGGDGGHIMLLAGTKGDKNGSGNDGETGSVVAAVEVLATGATDGFLYVPSCAGTPTGTPTAQTGGIPIVVDSTNHKLYFYSGGSWRDAGP